MSRPPLHLARTSLGSVLTAPLLFALPVAAQQAPTNPPTETGLSLVGQAIGAAVFTLVVGGLLVLVAPEYTERTTDRAIDNPGETFLFGVGIFVAAVVVIFLLAITIVGLVLVIPIVVALAVVAELGYLAFGRAVVDDWPAVLLVSAAVAAFAGGVPLLGGLVGFLLGCVGTGAWYLEYRDGGSGTGSGSTGVDSTPGGTAGAAATAGSASGGWGSDRTTGNHDRSADVEATDGTADSSSGCADAGDDTGDGWTAGFGEDDRE